MASAVSKDKQIMKNLIGKSDNDEQGGSALNSRRTRNKDPSEIVQNMNLNMLASKRRLK